MARRAVRTHLTGRKRSVRGAAAALLFLIIALQLLSMGYCGTRKFGMHEDEYYSYYSTNRSTGLYLSDRTWVDSGDLRKEFIALPGESLDLALVKTVQSWDVHPPLYYYALRTACYLTPGVFSKWQGLAVNFIGFFFAQLILAALSYHLSGSRAFSLMITAAWGFSPVAFSAVMFIRMYQWLIVWTLLQLLLLVLLMEEMSGPAAGGRCSLPEAPATAAYRSNMKFRSEPRGGAGKSFCATKRPGGTPESRPRRQTPVRLQRMRQHRTTVLLALMALCTFCGFLTQYYYLIILFFEGACFELYALTHSKGEQRLKTCGEYALAQLLALAAGVLYYPASLSQIFHGYRGREAQTEFIDPSNTLDRWKTFLGLINDQLFADCSLFSCCVEDCADSGSQLHPVRDKLVSFAAVSDPAAAVPADYEACGGKRSSAAAGRNIAAAGSPSAGKYSSCDRFGGAVCRKSSVPVSGGPASNGLCKGTCGGNSCRSL